MKDTTAPPLRALTARSTRPTVTGVIVLGCAILLNRVLTQSGGTLLLIATVLVAVIAGAILALPLLDRIPARSPSTRRVGASPAAELHLVPRR